MPVYCMQSAYVVDSGFILSMVLTLERIAERPTLSIKQLNNQVDVSTQSDGVV